MDTPADMIEKAAIHAAAMLDTLGLGGDDHTATRLVRALDELAYGRHQDAARHLNVQFPPTAGAPFLIVVTDVPFTSLCEHHMLPFTGIATVGYLPAEGMPIVGLSKLARMLQEFAARPQLQERLADQVATAMHTRLRARGAACAIRGVHTCMALRGARTGLTAAMVTVQYAGEVGEDPWRGEFASRLNTPPWRQPANQ